MDVGFRSNPESHSAARDWTTTIKKIEQSHWDAWMVVGWMDELEWDAGRDDDVALQTINLKI